MPSILPGVRFSVKEKLCKQLRRGARHGLQLA
jgi:hypothetical protein